MADHGRVLMVCAHPAYHRSRANRALRTSVEGLDGVTLHDLYETYPDFLIDVDAEQARLVAHDHIVLLHPFYWYSGPSLLKEWLDMVLEHGWAYGDDGRALAGKGWIQAATAGGPAASYGPDGRNRFTMEELLRPFEATAHLCGCVWRPPFILHDSRQLDAAALIAASHAFRARIEELSHG